MNKHNIKNFNADEKLEEDSIDNKDDNFDSKSNLSKQKSLGSSNLINNNFESLEKKNSRTQSTKHILKSEGKHAAALTPINSRERKYSRGLIYDVDDKNMMKSGFTRAEIEEINEDNFKTTSLITMDSKSINSEHKFLMKNEFSNNMKSNWFLTNELKIALKNQEKNSKKRRCGACKILKIDTKVCQCSIF